VYVCSLLDRGCLNISEPMMMNVPHLELVIFRR
jgi:hypothetical protein